MGRLLELDQQFSLPPVCTLTYFRDFVELICFKFISVIIFAIWIVFVRTDCKVTIRAFFRTYAIFIF